MMSFAANLKAIWTGQAPKRVYMPYFLGAFGLYILGIIIWVLSFGQSYV
jgi:hypothetical protein